MWYIGICSTEINLEREWDNQLKHRLNQLHSSKKLANLIKNYSILRKTFDYITDCSKVKEYNSVCSEWLKFEKQHNIIFIRFYLVQISCGSTYSNTYYHAELSLQLNAEWSLASIKLWKLALHLLMHSLVYVFIIWT